MSSPTMTGLRAGDVMTSDVLTVDGDPFSSRAVGQV